MIKLRYSKYIGDSHIEVEFECESLTQALTLLAQLQEES